MLKSGHGFCGHELPLAQCTEKGISHMGMKCPKDRRYYPIAFCVMKCECFERCEAFREAVADSIRPECCSERLPNAKRPIAR